MLDEEIVGREDYICIIGMCTSVCAYFKRITERESEREMTFARYNSLHVDKHSCD